MGLFSFFKRTSNRKLDRDLASRAKCGTPYEIKQLLDKGAKINSRTGPDGYTPIMIAALENSIPQALKFLIKSGADINKQGFDGMTALMIAAKRGHIDEVKYLVKNGAKINKKNKKGEKAIDLAFSYNWPEIVTILQNPKKYKIEKESQETIEIDRALKDAGKQLNGKELKEEKAASNKPVLVMIWSEGPPLEDESFIDRILQLPEIQREVAGRRCRVRTFGEPSGLRQQLEAQLGPTDPETQTMMDAFAMQINHAPDYQRPSYYCTVTNPVNGQKYSVVVCQP